MILKAQEKCPLSKEQHPRCLYIYEDTVPSNLVKFYRGADLIVFPTRAESWGWIVLEAMACGIPSLVTGFGGHLEYASSKTSYLLDYELVESDYHEQGSNSLWAYVNSNYLAEQMYEIYKKGKNDKEYQDKVKNGLIECMDWTWDCCSLKLIEFMKGLKNEEK